MIIKELLYGFEEAVVSSVQQYAVANGTVATAIVLFLVAAGAMFIILLFMIALREATGW